MCFSDSKVNSIEIKQSFKEMVKSRKNYTSENQLSYFLLSIIEYMEAILQIKVGYAVNEQSGFLNSLPCCGNRRYQRNVRKQFQKAYEECNSREQLQYYRKFINQLTKNTIPMPFAEPKNSLSKMDSNIGNSPIIQEGQLSFDVQIKGKFTWASEYLMTLHPDRNTLVVKQLTKYQETSYNLRNYILRQSKLSKDNSFVLCRIVPVEEAHLRFAIQPGNKNIGRIIGRLKEAADKALQQNVKNWKQPVNHIVNARLMEGQKRIDKTNVFDAENTKQKKQASPQVKISNDINDPLKKRIIDKAKIGFVKKAKQYNQTIVDGASKRSKISSVMQQENNQQEFKEFDSQKAGQAGGAMKAVKNIYANDDLALNNNNNNLKLEDAFKKKAKGPLSENQAPNLQHLQIKRKPSLVKIPQNYAVQPSDTRSQSGLNKIVTDNTTNKNINMRNTLNLNQIQPIKSQIKGADDLPDSSKSLLNDLEKAIIFEQEDEEFGNASELSYQESSQSFQTIPDQNNYK